MVARPSDTLTTAVCLLLALVLAGCSSAPASRYSQKHDSAPQRKLDPDRIADAEPRTEVIRAAGNKSPYQVFGKTYRVMDAASARNFRQQGVASWYGSKFHGHLTSNGETYNMYQMSAAHKSLPIPCYVRVTNLDNGRTAIVRVNDRGPFHGDRIIDLSYAAATKLGYSDKGVARVSVEVIDAEQYQLARRQKQARPAPAVSAIKARPVKADSAISQLYLQVAAFRQFESAEALRQRLLSLLDAPVLIFSSSNNDATLHRVRIGPLGAPSDAERISAVMARENYSKPHLVYH